jgi:hypothetical protein
MIDVTKAPHAPAWLARRKQPFCYLCGKPSSFVTVYLPPEGSPAARPDGDIRMIIYSLCRGCAERFHELAETIEARIASQIQEADRNQASSTPKPQEAGSL